MPATTPEHGPETATPGGGPRRPAAPRPLPSGRAALGGLLVTLAVLGTVLVARSGDGGPSGSYVVAVEDLVPGVPIDSSAVELQSLTLSADVAGAAFDDVAQLDGGAAVAPIRAGELVQRGDIREREPETGLDQLAIAIPRARGLNGDLDLGDRVDVLATYGSGETATTEVVAVGGLVIGADSDVDTVGATGEIVVTLGLDAPDTVLAVAHAGAVADVTLARSSATAAAPGAAEYRAPRETGS